MSEEVLDLKADVALARDELKAALKVVAMQTAAILELHDRVAVQGKLLVLVSEMQRKGGA